MEDNTLNEALERVIASLTEEQKEKVKDCKDINELTVLLGKLGVELPDELLDDVGGGFNLNTFFNRPMVRSWFDNLFKSESDQDTFDATHMDLKGRPGVGAVHMDLKGKPSVSAVHTDVSAGTRGQGKSRYV